MITFFTANKKGWKGERKKHEKRGFLTRREALAYEREFLAKTSKDIKMGFGLFLDIYLKDMRSQLKASTMANKENVIETHIRPYFENKSLSEINSTDLNYHRIFTIFYRRTFLKRNMERMILS